MNATRLSCILAALFALRFATLAAAEPQPLPTMPEIQKLYDDKQNAEALRAISRVTSLRQIPAEYDKYALFTLKAECHLRLRQQPLAVDGFEKAADATESEADRCVASATALLLKKSSGFAYKPKSGPDGKPPQPIDVIEPEPRKQALAALFEDEWKAKQATLKRARQRGSLPQLSSAVEIVSELRTLEVAATGKDERCRDAVAEIVDAAADAIAAALPKMDAAVREIDRRAMEVIINEKEGWSGPRGLTSNDMQELRGIMTSCEKTAQAIDGLLKIADVGTRPRLKDMRRAAELVYESAKTTLTRDYRRVKRPGRGGER
jgi:hypothetical protein